MTMNIQNKNQWRTFFFDACGNGNLQELRHLCQKQYLDLGWADIHINDEKGFRWACWSGHLDVVQYLLTSPELKEAGHTFAQLHIFNENGFRLACEYGHLEIVKYLLTSPELKEAGHSWCKPHARNDNGFRWACEYEHWNVVRWLIMDYKINKTPAIENILQDHPQAQEYFQVRDELTELQKTMPVDQGANQKQNNDNERAPKKAKKL